MPAVRVPRDSRAVRLAIRVASALAVAGSLLSIPPSPYSLSAVAIQAQRPTPLREPSWSPDGKRLAVVSLDRIWSVAPDGRDGRALTTDATAAQREPAWSPDGRLIAFAGDRGDGFDLYVVSAKGGAPERVTMMAGDERSPSWTPAGGLVFSHRDAAGEQWDLFLVTPEPSGSWGQPRPLTDSADSETQPRVSPDGRRVAFASNRSYSSDSGDGDVDIWLLQLGIRDAQFQATRVLRAAGLDGYPAWSPDGRRLAFYGVRDGVGATWVVDIDPLPADGADPPLAPRDRPEAPPVLASRHGGSVAWSPDGRTLAIGELPDPEPTYNGNPRRDWSERPAQFGVGRAYQLWTVPAPRAVDEGARGLAASWPLENGAYAQAFDHIWSTLRRLYYESGEGARQWDALRAKYRGSAARAPTERGFEDVVDRMVAEQPLIKPDVTSSRAVVVSGHPLASEAGRLILSRGGNVVDAMIAVSFALGVVEPDASGIGGDGQAVLFLSGMAAPTVVEYKDETPGAATLGNPKIFRGGQLIGDGAAAANIPGVVAGMDFLYRHYGSGRVSWAELLAPAIGYAEEGFVLDASLPSSLEEGRRILQQHREAARIFMPGGRVPKAGDRFVNPDYGATLRTIAREGADAFYHGSIASRIAEDMEAHGGVMTASDLAQYHAVERAPVVGRYRGHVVYTAGPPVDTGVSLLETLQVMAGYDATPGSTPASDADYWHYLIESWKVRDRIRRIADPERWPVEYESHLLPAHAAEMFRRIRRDTASRYLEEDDARTTPSRLGRGTTAFVVVDADGNMISATQTLSTWGGSFYVSGGLGFLYNNHLHSSPIGAGDYGRLTPLMRSNTTSVPTLVFREQDGERRPRLALGVAGNDWISTTAYSIITGVVDGGLSMQAAIEAPRFLVGRDPADPYGTGARVDIEDRFPRAVLENLMARGHRFRKIGRKGEVRYGYAAAALVDLAAHRVEGGSEPRRSHLAVAVDGPARDTQ